MKTTIQDKAVPPKPVNDKVGSDAYVNIEDEDQDATSHLEKISN